MISRFAITPETLSETRCSSSTVLHLCVGCLNDLCLAEAMFADMRNGEWSRAVDIVGPLGKKFLAFARKNRRLMLTPPQVREPPDNDEQWLWEALAVHKKFPCHAILTTKELAEQYPDPPTVCIEQINQTSWWEARSPSKTVHRTTAGYLQALDLISRHANSFMFIDAYIDPRSDNYGEFPSLLLATGANNRRPLIEIHRASWRKAGGKNDVQPLSRWIDDFEPWSKTLENAGLNATVFLWEKMHDRYLITDIGGINVPYGFDIASDPNETSTWSRLGVADRDKHQREFDRASSIHGYVGSFNIGIID